MKKRRSVTKLTEKDTKMASKYVLTTQHLDSEGEVATQLVKVFIQFINHVIGRLITFVSLECWKDRYAPLPFWVPCLQNGAALLPMQILF